MADTGRGMSMAGLNAQGPSLHFKGLRFAVRAESAVSDDIVTLARSSLPGRPTSELFDLDAMRRDPRYARVWVEDTWNKE